ncbi:DNA-binding PucR family transcriptional regulator [Natranaerovirga pectinivora]|uniref:DNA-binding PucR family transcriptional regulator n=1 Tax=Natranaerovirga pectinivora TaxID=682400 RepID=A0A4R3MLC0_9FIRM|nr:PucR family transcriptional regulator ligand-binding domain-containing protein [Natranaerovirga pectinivora]TCT15496.1 DNA-binding PucR family transcriptional regulator [Natranaerovirga pectinivora]
MAITLRHLCKYAKENYGMKLICGEKNMNNVVTWVHMLEDPETASFLHGQELIFSTGIGQDNTDWFVDFVKGLVDHKASGLVLNLGPYIKAVPQDLIDYCNEVQFPLFTVPWKTRIVDITNDFCRKIVKAEENEETVASAFRNAIFFPEKSFEYRPILERKAFNLDAEFSVVAISLQVPSNDKLAEYDKSVRLHLKKLLDHHSDRFSIFRQDKYVIAVLQNFPLKLIEGSLTRLKEICNNGQSYKIRSAISESDFGILSLPRNYRRAISVLRVAERQNKDQLSYGNIGLYQLLIEVEDMKVLKKFYEDTLGPLASFDEKNGTDYMDILKSYLEHNNSVEKVAKEAYVHRNTINYKIKKIKEILGSDLDYQEGLKLLMAFHIIEFL